MTDVAPDVGVENEEQAPQEAPDSGASVVPEENGAAPDAPTYPWSKDYPDWGPEDIAKAYSEARTKISRGEQEAPPAAEEQYDPYAQLPAGDDPALVEQLAGIFSGQQAFNDGSYGPKAVLEWLASNGDLSQQTKGQFFEAWRQQDAWGAQAWFNQHTLASERERMREELRQEYAPAVESTRAAMNSTAISLAAQEVPDWDAWVPKVTHYLEQENPHALAGVSGAEQVAERLCDIVGLLAMRDQRQARKAAAKPAAPPASAATQTKSRGNADSAQAKRTNDALAGMQRVRGLI